MQHFIASYGITAVFLLMIAESACIPVPSELVMCLGGALAAGAVAGAHPSLLAVIAAGVAGNLAGSYLAWAAGRYGGEPALRRYGRYLRLRDHDLDRASAWFNRHGRAAVFFGRMVPVVRTFISLPAGIAGMPAARFGLYTVAGCIPWTAGLALAGYGVGRNWQAIVSGFRGPSYAIAGILAVLLIVAVAVYARRRAAGSRRRPAHAAGTPQGTGTPATQAGRQRSAR